MTAPSFDETLAASLQSLAALADGDLSGVVQTGLPTPWSLYQTFTGGSLQGFIALGTLSSGLSVVVALGITWPKFLRAYQLQPRLVPLPIPSSLVGETTTTPTPKGLIARAAPPTASARAALPPDPPLSSEPSVLCRDAAARAWARLHLQREGTSDALHALAALERAADLHTSSMHERAVYETLLPYLRHIGRDPAQRRARVGGASSSPVATTLMVSSETASQYDGGTTSIYMGGRDALWAAVKAVAKTLGTVATVPLLVTGHGVGGALASLAAYDFRPNKLNATLQFKSIRSYCFSTPALADASFQSAFRSAVPDAWTVDAALAGNTGTIDFFPSAPNAAEGWFALGNEVSVTATLPVPDDPWWERSGAFYATLYQANANAQNDAPQLALVSEHTTLVAALSEQRAARRVLRGESTPAGYDRDTAYTATKLSATVAGVAQHPGLGPLGMPPGFTIVASFPPEKPWASLFSSVTPARVVVAFRAAVSFEETIVNLLDVGPSTVAWLPGAATLHAGAAALYESIRDDLRSTLARQSWANGAQLIITGHSLGAMVALCAALDLGANALSGVPRASSYCFGGLNAAGMGLATVPQLQALKPSIFLINRDRDTLAEFSFGSLLAAFGTEVWLSGATPYDGNTGHPLDAYTALLDPSGP